MRRLVFAVLLVFLGVLSVAAQAPPPVVVSEALSPLELKNLEVWQLKRQLTQAYRQVAELQALVGACQGQLGTYQATQNTQALDAEEKTLIEAYEQAHPGFTFSPKTGATSKKPVPSPGKS